MVKPIEEGSEIGPTPLADTRNAPVLAQGGGESGQATNPVEARLNLFLAPSPGTSAASPRGELGPVLGCCSVTRNVAAD
jgi:hypothetical protein